MSARASQARQRTDLTQRAEREIDERLREEESK
jgi:hypothetical protein